MSKQTASNNFRVLDALQNGRVLSVKEMRKMGIKNTSACISHLRNDLGYSEIFTTEKGGVTAYGM